MLNSKHLLLLTVFVFLFGCVTNPDDFNGSDNFGVCDSYFTADGTCASDLNNQVPLQTDINNTNPESLPKIELSVSTDKNVYSSNEDISVRLEVLCEKELPEVTVRIQGIKPKSYAYISESRLVSLGEGINILEFFDQIPACTGGCGGVYPGFYDVNAVVEFEGNILASAKTTIELINE